MKYCFIIIFSLVSSTLFSQLYDVNWNFGYYASISFIGNNPVDNGSSSFSVAEGCSSISDKNGNLLFSTNGETVFDRFGNVMPNGYKANGNVSSTQNVLIVPFPGDTADRYFYLFTVPAQVGWWGGPSTGLEYVVIDMELNNGLGDISGNSIELLEFAGEKIHATWHANNRDVWVMVHLTETNKYYAYLVDCNGINDPVISSTGGYQTSDTDGHGAIGALKISPDGSRIASTYNTQGPNTILYNAYLDVGTFDNSTGVVEISTIISKAKNNPYAGYSLEFSPDNSKLYWSCLIGSEIYQYDFNAPNFLSSETIVTPIAAVKSYATMQLAPNGKIYIARSNGANYLSSIEDPNQAGLACNFIDQAVPITGTSMLGLPNQWMFPYPKLETIPDTSLADFCTGYDAQLAAPGNGPYNWSTGEISKAIIVADSGVYWVTEYDGCQTDTTRFIVSESDECFCELFVPNAFTPNGDGINDGFGAIMQDECEIVDFSMLVFNRWGEVEFEFTDVSQRWNGQNAMDMVYLWKAVYSYRLGSKVFYKEAQGHITMLR